MRDLAPKAVVDPELDNAVMVLRLRRDAASTPEAKKAVKETFERVLYEPNEAVCKYAVALKAYWQAVNSESESPLKAVSIRQQMGYLFEDFVHQCLRCLNGEQVEGATKTGPTGQLDAYWKLDAEVLRYIEEHGGVALKHAHVLCEVKATQSRFSVSQMSRLLHLASGTGLQHQTGCIIVFTLAGLTGAESRNCLGQAQLLRAMHFYHTGVPVVVISVDRLQRLATSGGFAAVLAEEIDWNCRLHSQVDGHGDAPDADGLHPLRDKPDLMQLATKVIQLTQVDATPNVGAPRRGVPRAMT